MGCCSYCRKGKNENPTEEFISDPPIEEDNTISYDEFFKLIPKQILEKMQLEDMFSSENENNYELKTVKIKNKQNDDKIFYHGDFNQNNEREGIGKMVIINSKNERIYYHGLWQKDELINGVIYYPNNSIYKGEIKNLLKNGKGEYLTETETYNGDFKDDQKEGKGLLTYKDGTEYNGEFKKNKLNGKGEITWPDGTFYSGEISNNIVHGKGYLKGSNAHTYHGDFSRGLFNGQGEFTWTKGVKMIKYKGNYSSGKKDGFGELYFNDGNSYKGGWESGLPQGEGIYETKNRKYYGNWRTGVFLQLIKSEKKEGCAEENINLNFVTPIEDIEIKGNFKLSNNSIFSSTYNTYNDVLVEVVKQN